MQINNDSIQNYTYNRTIFAALPKKYRKVDEYLIRGPHPYIKDIIQLKREGVNRIYDFRHYNLRGFKFIERLACKIAGIEYIRKPYDFLKPQYPTQAEYETIAKEVKENGENGGKTLFHCRSGSHRTSLMAAFYDITKGHTLKESKESPSYEENLKNTLGKHIINSNYFSRKHIVSDTRNPIKKHRISYNNIVEAATRKAYELFLDMMNK